MCTSLLSSLSLITQCHTEIREAPRAISAKVRKEMLHETVIKESNDADAVPAFTADLAVWGVWQPWMTKLIDVCVIDTHALSYVYMLCPDFKLWAGFKAGRPVLKPVTCRL